MSDLVIVSDDGPIRTVRMNRPDKKNALTVPMYEVMAGLPGAFCAGNDLQDFLHAVAHAEGLSAPLLRFLHVLARNEKPLVAAVSGLAVAIGTTMRLHCHHVVAATA